MGADLPDGGAQDITGADLSAADLSAADLSGADLSAADLTNDLSVVPDLSGDLSCGVMPGCTNGVQTECSGGAAVMRTCGYGCSGVLCTAPEGCANPADVSAGAAFDDTTDGFADDAAGSCGGAGSPDALVTFTTTSWRTVTISTNGSAFDTVLYTRLTCSDPSSELPIDGPCVGGLQGTTSTACSDDAPGGLNGSSQLVLCNLPPQTPYYTWIDGKTGASGEYLLTVSLGPPALLNSCASAGNLLDGNNRTFSATTAGHANTFVSTSTCGDSGTSSPDATFFLAVTTARTVTFTTSAAFKHILYLRSACSGPDLACSFSGGTGTASLTHALTPGLYYVIVDGVMGASGPFTLNVK
jgi:hypothetical protein